MLALTCEMSATSDSMPWRTSSGSGIGQAGSPTASPAARTRSHSSAVPITPATRLPSATTCPPVSVDVSSR
jgi:hypothetical protein